MTESDDDRRRLLKHGDEAAREFREKAEPGHFRADLVESDAINPDSGPGHYAEASRYARSAAAALDGEKPDRALALAAIGQIHATLAAASAAALHEEYGDIRGWRHVTGQEGR